MKLYSHRMIKNNDEIKLCGVLFYRKEIIGEISKERYLCGILKKREDRCKKKMYLLGIQVFSKKKVLSAPANIDYNRIAETTQRIITTALLHQHTFPQLPASIDYNRIAETTQRIITTALLHQNTFPQFKGCNREKDVVLVAAGPTVNYYRTIENAVHVGVNRSFKKEDIKFDYLFTIDKLGLLDCEEEFYNYNCIKFIGDQNTRADMQIPADFCSEQQIYRYKTNVPRLPPKLYVDIDSNPLLNAETVTIQAMQVILYTQPKRIFLVGIDCTVTTNQYFWGSSVLANRPQNVDDKSIVSWSKIRDFAACYYPNTEIISINPVRLAGMFKDVYTRGYLDANSEVKEKLGGNIYYLEEII